MILIIVDDFCLVFFMMSDVCFKLFSFCLCLVDDLWVIVGSILGHPGIIFTHVRACLDMFGHSLDTFSRRKKKCQNREIRPRKC